MARPIQDIELNPISEKEVLQEDLNEILVHIANNRQAIEDSISILKELHESGAIDIVKGLLATRDKVGAIAMDLVNQPDMLMMVRNVISLVEFMSSIESEQLKRMLDGVLTGLEYASEHQGDKSAGGIWGAFKATKDPNVKASLHTMFNFLEGMGQSFKEEHDKYH